MKMKKINAERYGELNFTRLINEDGSCEEYTTIYGGISFPVGGTSGLILIGGLVRDAENVKILVEKEFRSVSECAELIKEVDRKFQPYCMYCQEGPEIEAYAAFVRRKSRFSITPTKFTENITFTVPLINDYLDNNKLLVPQGGVLMKELQRDWESHAIEEKPPGVTALACLLSGILFHPRFFSPIDLDRCAV